MKTAVSGNNETSRGKDGQPHRVSLVQYLRKSGISTICGVRASCSSTGLPAPPQKMRRARLEEDVTCPRSAEFGMTPKRTPLGEMLLRNSAYWTYFLLEPYCAARDQTRGPRFWDRNSIGSKNTVVKDSELRHILTSKGAFGQLFARAV